MDHQPKFFENLSGAGKAIAVLTSGGDAQVSREYFHLKKKRHSFAF